MIEKIKEIAERLRGLRQLCDISIEEMANVAGVSIEEYQAYESGEVDIPVSVLYAAASNFNVQLSAILTGEDPKLRVYSLVRKEKGLKVERRKEYKYQNLAYNFVNKKAEPFLVIVEPNDDPISLNSHSGHEIDYVIEGSVLIQVGEHKLTLNEGDTLYYDSVNPHGMKALGGKPAKFLAIIL